MMRARDLVERYLQERAAAWAAYTLRREGRTLADFLRCVKGDLIQAEDVVAYAADVRSRATKTGQPLQPRTISGLLGPVRRLLTWAFVRGHLLQDLSRLIVVRQAELLPRTLSEGEVEALIEKGARGARERAVLELLYGTGLRASELCRLQLEDVDLAEGLICVREGKGRKDRLVPFGERVRAALLAYLREARPSRGGPLFLSARGRPLTRGRLGLLVWQAGKRAGLERLASPHRLRHSYATHLLRNGADVVSIKRLLGHASLVSTQVYLGVDVTDLKRMLERSHPREKRVK